MNYLNTKLIKVNEIDELDSKKIEKIYIENINPGQVYYFKLLGFNKILIKRAKGVYYYKQNDEKITLWNIQKSCFWTSLKRKLRFYNL